MIISFDEITDHVQFEDLAVSYFESLQKTGSKALSHVETKPSGIGTDGGRDILVKMTVHDSLYPFARRWVVQCKFHNSAISTSEIADINIPSLIHSYKADGYILICRNKPTSKLTDFLEHLEQECKFGYLYKSWYGEHFIGKMKDKMSLLNQYFPKYAAFLESKNLTGKRP